MMKIRQIFHNNLIDSTYILFVITIIPALFTGFLINTYSVNVPYWDQWSIAPLFEKIHNGSLTLNDLISQHNESRKLFPRLIFIGLAFFTTWDVRYEMLISFLLACIVSFNIYRLSSLTIKGSLIKKLCIAAISNLFIFAPIQWENWLWGIQIVVFIPIACITTCLLIAYSRLTAKTQFCLFVCLCTISTFSYANGILLWIVLFPVFFINNRLNNKKWLIFSWVSAFVINATVYFYNYKKPSQHPSFLEVVVHPIHGIHYFLSFLGAPLGLSNGSVSLMIGPMIGLVLILILLTSFIYLFRFANDRNLLDNLAAWLTISTYTLISAVITTSGRVGFGVEQSLASRYTTFSVYLIISLIYIVVIIYDDIQNKSLLSKQANKNLLSKSMIILTIIMLFLHLLTSVNAVQMIKHINKDRLSAKACLQFINILPDDCLKKKVFPNTSHLIKYANEVDKLDFLTPPLVKNSILEEGRQENNLIRNNNGFFENITKNADGLYMASGWAVLSTRIKPADSVIMTYEISKGKFRMFSLVNDINLKRFDVADYLRNDRYLESGWQKYFSLPENTSGVIKIEAWGYDANTGKYFKLNGSHIVQK